MAERGVTGETRVWVNGRGLVQIRELVGQTPGVATFDDGVVFRSAQVSETDRRSIVKVTTREGIELRLTNDVQLSVKDRLQVALAPPVAVNLDAPKLKLAEVVGWLAGSGNFNNDRATLAFRNEWPDAAERLLSTLRTFVGGDTSVLGGFLYEQRLFKLLADVGIGASLKHALPEWVWRGSLEVIVGYLRGLFSATARIENDTIALYLPVDLKREVQQLLLRCGVRSAIGGGTRNTAPYLSPTRGSLGTFMTSIGFLDASKTDEVAALRARFAAETAAGTDAARPKMPPRYGRDDATAFAAFASQFDDILEANFAMSDVAAREARQAARERTRLRQLELFETGWSTIVALEPDGDEPVFELTEPSTGQFFANGLLVR